MKVDSDTFGNLLDPGTVWVNKRTGQERTIAAFWEVQGDLLFYGRTRRVVSLRTLYRNYRPKTCPGCMEDEPSVRFRHDPYEWLCDECLTAHREESYIEAEELRDAWKAEELS